MKLFFLFTLILSLFGLTLSFNYTDSKKGLDKGMVKNFKIDATKPSIFLEFENFGEIIRENSNLPVKTVFLRLHNNTNFPIAVDANFDSKILQSEKLVLSDGNTVKTIPDKSLVDVCFDIDVIPYTTSVEDKGKIISGVQLKKENPAENDKTTCFWRNAWRGDEFGNGERIWIKPKQSIIFAVPKDYFKENLKVSTLFSYEWEFYDGKLNFDEPKHKVYFYGSDLPR